MSDLPDDDPASRLRFARRLRAVRLAYGAGTGQRGLSMNKFARALGLSSQRYGRYERAEIEPPIGVLAEIRRLTGCALDMLIAGELPGDGNMIASDGMTDDDDITLADRLRWTRSLLAPEGPREVAATMRVPLETWIAWENGLTRPPVEKMREFAHRFRVTLNFLYEGQINDPGIDPEVKAALVSRHFNYPEGHRPDRTRRICMATPVGTSSRRAARLVE